MSRTNLLLSLLLGLLLIPCSFGQEAPPGAVYVILDGSGSMWGRLADDSMKIEAARKVLNEFLVQDFGGADLAFRVYGHRREGDCRDSELTVPFTPAQAAAPKVQASLQSVKPLGKTPITYSLEQALNDFGERSGELILITDGIETCNADPCALVRAWREKGVEIRVHVVGFGLDAQAKDAMRCIADAAGTPYYDAPDGAALAEALGTIREQTREAAPQPAQPMATVALKIVGVDEQGNKVRVQGALFVAREERYRVTSNGRNVVEPGDYELRAGMMTSNDNLYKPVSQEVTVAPAGETTVTVTVDAPPRVRARFVERGEKHRGALVHAFQDGKEVFKFRAKDEAFLDEGSYEFRSQPNPDNKLSVSESFAAGDRKEVLFELTSTVHVRVKFVASGTGTPFRNNAELWQDGKKRYGVHARNGARVLPGTYTVKLPHRLTPYEVADVEIANEPTKELEFEVPVGHVTIRYQKADGSPDADKRCFIGRGTVRNRFYHGSGKPIPLTPGDYSVIGWRGPYDMVPFAIAEGQEKEIVLRAKE